MSSNSSAGKICACRETAYYVGMNFFQVIKKIVPAKVFNLGAPVYHWLLAFLGAVIYRFPSRHLTVIGITGTKGKTSTAEFLNAMLEEAGFRTALTGTLRFKIGRDSKLNLYRMTMPGRFFIQKFLRRAVDAGCRFAVIELTSEGARQFRHAFIALDALVFLNLAPEHIESHGSYEKYRQAKLSLGRALLASPKPNPALIINGDDSESEKFLALAVPRKVIFQMNDAENLVATHRGVSFDWRGERFTSTIPGIFTLANILAAASAAAIFGVNVKVAARAVEKLTEIKGRVQRITLSDDDSLREKQNFEVIVDYAHTPDSLEAVYKTYANFKKVCVLGGTGGGRDRWKRPAMGGIADKHCQKIFLTNEDPYDEAPEKIAAEIAAGVKKNSPTIIMDRRAAIHEAIREAARLSGAAQGESGVAALITGKGTDPCICGPRGAKTPWSDAAVAREELRKVLKIRGGE